MRACTMAPPAREEIRQAQTWSGIDSTRRLRRVTNEVASIRR
jgi:hypothetical protein